MVAYITIVGCLIAITMNLESRNAFARFHIRQAFGTHLFFHAFAIALTYLEIAYTVLILYVLYLLMLCFGLLQVLQLRSKPLPGFGKYFQKWFTFIQ